jgi:hypothetical protein
MFVRMGAAGKFTEYRCRGWRHRFARASFCARQEQKMKRFIVAAALAAGVLAAVPGFAQTAADATKQPTQSFSHSDATKQKTQSFSHSDATKQKTQSFSHSNAMKQKTQSMSHADPSVVDPAMKQH